MKKLTILSAIAMSGLIYSTANAQMSIRVGLHFGTPVAVRTAPVYNEPVAVSYDGDDDYYYLPDVDAYYSVSEQCYYYFDGDSWISAAFLPGEYRDYDWRTARRYEVKTPRPYMHDEIYRSRYDGHEVTAWAHASNNEHYNAPVQRNYSQSFDNRSQGNYLQPAQRDNGQRFENRGQVTNYQPATQNNGQRFNNSGQGSTSHSAQSNKGQGNYSQPSNQGGRDRGNNNNGQHYTSNGPQGGFSTRKMTRF